MIAMPGDLQHPALRPVRPSSAPHGPPEREVDNVNINRRSLSAILGPMPFTFEPAELQMLAQAKKERKKKRRRTSSTVSRDSAEYYRAARPDHDNLLACTGYLADSHDRPVFDDDDALRYAQDLVPVFSERGDNWPIVSSAFPSPHHMSERHSVVDRTWQPNSNVSPISARQVPLDNIPGVDHGLQTSPTNRSERIVDVVSVGDVPVVLQRADADDMSVMEQRDGDLRNDLRIHDTNQRHMSFQADIVRPGDVTPVSSQGKTNALVIPDEYEKHRQSPSSLSSLNGAVKNYASGRALESQRRRAYETEMIGAGDVSPVSTRSFAMKDDDATPKVEKIDPGTTVWFAKSNLQLPRQATPDDARVQNSANTNSNKLAPSDEAEERRTLFDSQTGEIALGPGVTREETLISAEGAPQAHSAASLDTTRPMPYAVRAVEEYSASNSSLASLDLDESNAALPVETIWRDNMKDESDLVTPVANVPRIVQNGPPAHKAEVAYDNYVNPTSDDYFPGHPSSSGPMQQNDQPQAVSNANMTAPGRSKSILSQISAMVSDADALSPAASTAGRSTPSTIRRMQVDSSVRPHVNPNQIPEETTPTWTSPVASGQDPANNYDLYEDHNGFVKDLPSNSRQSTRGADQSTLLPPEHYPVKPASVAGSGSLPPSRDGERSRYSTERPMSFVSGRPDEAGNRQDQINRLGSFGPPSDTQAQQIPEQHPEHSGHRQIPSIGMAFSSSESVQEHWLPGPVNPNNQPVASTVPRSAAPTATNIAAEPLPGHSIQDPRVYGNETAQNGNLVQQMPSDGRAYGHPTGQDPPHGGSVGKSALMPDHDPRAQEQFASPRNQYEYHQQMMQHQTNGYSREASTTQAPLMPGQYSNDEGFSQETKSASKPRLSSMFKGLAGKSQQGSQQQSNSPHITADSSLKPHSLDPVRNHSSHSAVSSLSTNQQSFPQRPNGPPPPIPNSHQASMGSEAQYHHASQPVVPAQPADFSFGGRNPGNVAQYQGMASHQHSAATPANGMSSFYQTTASGPAETGKKKRFSSLGALFGRVTTASDGLLTKSKEKKAQKAQRYSTPLPSQTSQPQNAPQPQQFRPQQPTLAYYPPGQLPPPSVPGVQPMGPQVGPSQARLPPVSQGAQNVPPRRGVQQPTEVERVPPQQQHKAADNASESGSAYLRTKQLAEEHRAQRGGGPNSVVTQNPGSGIPASHTSVDQRPVDHRQFSWGTPSADSYKPQPDHHPDDNGTHAARVAAQQQAENWRKEDETRQQALYARSQVEQVRAQQQRQAASPQQDMHQDPRMSRQQMQQHRQHPMFKGTYGQMQGELQQNQQDRQQATSQQQEHYEAALAQRQQSQPPSQQPVSGYGQSRVAQVLELQRQQQQQQQQQQQHYPQHANGVTSPHTNRSVSSPPSVTDINTPAKQRHVSSPIPEPQYDAPPIPAAYSHVSGAFVSPNEQPQQPVSSPHQDPRARFDSTDNGMQSISPQISAQSEMARNARTHSDTSAVSVISPISQSPDPSMTSPPSSQRIQQNRMSSITEVHQHDRPWHLNFPEGATEQEIVRARQRQYMKEQFTTQQQLHAERAARSSPPHAGSMFPATVQDQTQGGGFRELLPRTTPQQYPSPRQSPDPHGGYQVTQETHPVQPAPVHPGNSSHAAAYPLPSSPDPRDIRSPVNPIANTLPPPSPPKPPMALGYPRSYSPSLQDQRQPSPQQYNSSPPPPLQHYPPPPDDPPPSYDGPGLPTTTPQKPHPDRPRPSNIDTTPRSRQASIGLLQHPQPASMAASPQRSSADMGAESLRRQLLQQEEYARMQRIQRAQMARVDSERERREREAARARARELELSASGGGQVGSLRRGEGRGGGGAGSRQQQVFELPAEEDEDQVPAMTATSYPGQESLVGVM
ncbi:hypothetical protein NX059_005474 [Plenodomus lindquistii]|nr:hypothetical protein NX059_005474 [Plenodomus lindquistii]